MVSASETQRQDRSASEVTREIMTRLLTPLVQPLATGGQILPQAAVESGIAFYESVKEAVAATGETLDDLVAELRASLEQELPAAAWRETPQRSPAEPNLIAQSLVTLAGEMNNLAGQATAGLVDLRLLLPLGLGALALNQLLKKGPDWESIPWNVLAWYAFDTFMKFNPPGKVAPQPPAPAWNANGGAVPSKTYPEAEAT